MPAKLSHLCILVEYRAPPNDQPMKEKGTKRKARVLYCPIFPQKENKTSHFSDANLIQDNLALVEPLTGHLQISLPLPAGSVKFPLVKCHLLGGLYPPLRPMPQ